MDEEEIWANVPDAPGYEISSHGRVRRYLGGTTTPAGYTAHHIRRPSRQTHQLTHRLVWEAFRGEIARGLHINHKNGLKTDNRLSNLELTTPLQNVRHAMRTGLWEPSGPNPKKANKKAHGASTTPDSFGRRKAKRDKLKAADIPIIRARLEQESCATIAKDYGVSTATISCVSRRKTWANVP